MKKSKKNRQQRIRRYNQIHWVDISGDGFDDAAYEQIMMIAAGE